MKILELISKIQANPSDMSSLRKVVSHYESRRFDVKSSVYKEFLKLDGNNSDIVQERRRNDHNGS